MGVPASVIVSGSSSGPAPSGHDSLLAETRQRQSPSPSLGPAHMATVVNKVDELMLRTKPHPLVAATAAYWTTVSQQNSLSCSVPLSFYCHCSSSLLFLLFSRSFFCTVIRFCHYYYSVMGLFCPLIRTVIACNTFPSISISFLLLFAWYFNRKLAELYWH